MAAQDSAPSDGNPPGKTQGKSMIRVDNLKKIYGNNTKKPAVDGISFEVRTGEVLGFVGPNGAGKTTTMKILTSFLAPTSGTAQIAGYDVYEQSVEARRRLGYLPEDTPLYKDMSVLEYLEWVARVRQMPRSAVRPAIKRAAEQCALTHRLGSLIGELSKGYRQRVGLAQAILHEPDVLILDEPTSGLDPNQIVEIRNVIRDYGKGRTVIFSTHILPEVQVTCSRVLVISDGKLVADATPSELGKIIEKARGTQLVVDFGDKVDSVRSRLEKIPGVEFVRPFSQAEADTEEAAAPHGQLIVGSMGMPGGPNGPIDLRSEIFRVATEANAPLLEMTRHAPLEEVFRHLTMQPGTNTMQSSQRGA